MTQLPTLSETELADLVRAGVAEDELSAATGVPVVRLTAGGTSAAERAEAAALAASLPAVVVADADDDPGLAPLVDVFANGAALTAIVDHVARTPLAAVALVLLLRGGAARTLIEGLVAESAVYSVLQAGPEFAAWRASRAVKARPEEADPVLVEREADLLHVTLNRPRVHNAVDARLREALAAALLVACADPTLRVLLDGAGRSFSSGGDLDEFGSFPDPASAHIVRLTRSPARLMARLSDRTEVHLHGVAMGAGIELAAFAGRVVAQEDTVIGLPELGLGLIPGAGGTVSLPPRIGRHRSALLGLTASPIDARTALDWGLVDEIVPG